MQQLVKEPLKMALLTPQEIVPFDPYDWQSVVMYLWHHKLQLFLLIASAVMVYYIDHLSNWNAVLFGPPGMSLPAVSAAPATAAPSAAPLKKMKRRK